jgi:DNA polymerase III delta prime subunit
MNREEFLWVEKYRPKTIEECILPDELKRTFMSFIEQGEIPNLLLAGSAGVGKTTVARALLEQIGVDYIVINGSLHGNIDTLRTDIMQFASTISFTGSRKYVILDEADYLNPNSTQPALRNFMEEFSRNCGFILTCNFPNRIIDPLHSRCSVVEFKISKDDLPKLAMQFMKRVIHVLNTEHISFDKSVVAELITKHIPDWRRVLNELQRYSVNGAIDSGIFVNIGDTSFKSLVECLKNKNFADMRKWVSENSDMDTTTIFRKMYDTANDTVKKNSIPELVLILSEYQYKAAFVADPEINLVAAFTKIMIDIEFE